MSNLTLYQAVLGELDPYSPSSLTIKKAMIDQRLNPTDQYDSAQKVPVIKAAVNVLKKMIVLSSDGMGKSSQGFNKPEELRKRITSMCKEAGLDVSDYIEIPSIEDGSHLW